MSTMDAEIRWCALAIERRFRFEWALRKRRQLELDHVVPEDISTILQAAIPDEDLSVGLVWSSLGRPSQQHWQRLNERETLPPCAILKRAFDLSELEYRLLLLIVAFELSPPLRLLAEALQGEKGGGITVETYVDILYPSYLGPSHSERLKAFVALDHHSTLHRYRLINLSQLKHPSFTGQILSLNAEVLRFLTGEQWERTSSGSKLVELSEIAPIDAAGLVEVDEILVHLEELGLGSPARRRSPQRAWTVVVAVDGGDGERVAKALLQSLQRRALVVDLSQFVNHGSPVLSAIEEETLRTIVRDALLFEAVPVLINAHPYLQPGERASAMMKIFELLPETGVIVLEEEVPELLEQGRPFLGLKVLLPTQEWREIFWAETLAEYNVTLERQTLKLLSESYVLSRSSIERATRHSVNNKADYNTDLLLDAARGQLRHALGSVAERVKTPHTLEDLVLPPAAMELLDEMMANIKYRDEVYEKWQMGRATDKGRGVSALFSGPPGTGKTMAAGVLANELGMELFRVDLSQVVSKWIGETEKNLGKVFDEAAQAQGILLFDEADSLFGSRTEVKSSVDRYANLEVNYLLQRMEAYDGICLLTTNFEKSIDDAFKRRLKFRIPFPFPDAETRSQIWVRLFGESVPLEPDIDWERIGLVYEIAGGHIRNAVLRAAFYAAREGEMVLEDHIDRAALRECREIGQLIRDD